MTAEPCCAAGQCDYRPQLVRLYLAVLHQIRASGDDVGEAAEAALAQHSDAPGRSVGFSAGDGASRYAIRLWDVELALVQLGVGRPSVDDICRRLCPWALDQP